MISTKDTPCPQCGSVPKCGCTVPALADVAAEFERQAVDQIARAAIKEGSKPSEMTREQQDLINAAGDNRATAHRIRRSIGAGSDEF